MSTSMAVYAHIELKGTCSTSFVRRAKSMDATWVWLGTMPPWSFSLLFRVYCQTILESISNPIMLPCAQCSRPRLYCPVVEIQLCHTHLATTSDEIRGLPPEVTQEMVGTTYPDSGARTMKAKLTESFEEVSALYHQDTRHLRHRPFLQQGILRPVGRAHDGLT